MMPASFWLLILVAAALMWACIGFVAFLLVRAVAAWLLRPRREPALPRAIVRTKENVWAHS